MIWTDITRREHSRIYIRYPSDLTDDEWAVALRIPDYSATCSSDILPTIPGYPATFYTPL